MNISQTKKAMVALVAALGLSGCGSMEIGDLNNPSLDDFRNNPTESGVNSAATGLIIGHRANVSPPNGYVAQLGVIGREAYVFDPADPRAIDEMLGPIMDPGGGAYGGNHWAAPYANIRNANTLLAALDRVGARPSDPEKEGIRGFAKTLMALDFLVIINTRDTNGAPIDVDRPLGQLAPIEGKEAVLNHILKLLDEGNSHLANAGGAFSFRLSTGFRGFETPAAFRKFNRAVRARASVYAGKHEEALAALSESFISANAPADEASKAATLASLSVGVYHVFRPSSGDTDNGLVSRNVYAHPSLEADAEKNGTEVADDRFKRKVAKLAEAATGGGGRLSTDLRFSLYPTADTSIPIIRNEELILLRAEANIGLRNFGPAAEDINYIRTRSGRLPEKALTEATIVDALLYERRYSLMFEGGHRWLDMRRFGRLDTLPRNLSPDFPPHPWFPIPVAEIDSRK
ncbi:lipoprotein [Myxococcus stipitatus DSM 14675]|uniref:Lipoprotein n=1 Tax=Myxococcus stipitatus (strain DSM 14675 / JCM 12634 / Mx s8) TaxID=1278073 RepID=L7UFZ7_MYXSD|nr:RagB/SusD family nutrient uptake outer membrane protein [Myxococcus stipitatus]AGC46487.1 lipoprotein [Myxococcus stipitatus DSM 14675]